MTLNQVVKRIETLALAHRQVRTFKSGLEQDFLSSGDVRYAAVFLQYGGANVLRSQNQANLGFRLWVLDLVHVSADTKTNELDVLSDTFSIILDLIAQMGFDAYNDWKISQSAPLQQVLENDGDMNAGWYADLVVSVMYDQNVCEVPSDIPGYNPTPTEDMKLVYDVKYTADGTEGSTLVACGEGAVIPEVCGKKILLVTREYSPLYRVSNLPQSTEFTWDDSEIGLGLPTMPGERFLILYRTY